MAEPREHIVMLPYMAHGHLRPFLALARQINQTTGFTITIATTPLNIHYLRSALSTDSNSDIHLAELPFCSTDHDLPPNTENTENLPLKKMATLCYASVSLKQPVHRLVSDIIEKEGRPPLCIVSDVFLGWAVDVAKNLGTVNVTFNTAGAYGILAYISLWLHLPHRFTDSDEFTVPGFPESVRFHRSQLHQFIRAADGTDSWSRIMQPQLSLCLGSSGWLCNTVEEIEPLGLDCLRKYLKLPIWTIGPILPLAASSNNSKPLHRPEECIEWLDLHSPDSVLYISFGSQNTIGATQMMELAIGLEESQIPFVWVIRPPLGFDIKGEFKPEWLPEGFEERMRETKTGFLVHNWAPQLEILSHKSTGAFLSHCGWNSVMESLSQGVPIIGWPMAAEQAYNSKMLVEEMGVSVELTRGIQNSIVGKEVKKLIELVMEKENKGGEMKKKAAQVKEQIMAAIRDVGEEKEKGSSIKAMDDFVRTMLSQRQEQ